MEITAWTFTSSLPAFENLRPIFIISVTYVSLVPSRRMHIQSMVPSIARILQSTDVLSATDASATVVKVDEYAVKFGTTVTLLEAETLRYITEHSNVPVPKVFKTWTDPTTRRNFIVMEMIQGQTLTNAWPSLTASEKDQVTIQIREALSSLRSMPSPGYIGSVGYQACADGVFWTPKDQYDPMTSGPFETEERMNKGIQRRLSNEQTAYKDFLSRLISATLCGHQIVFTHGDLQPKNILVTRIKNTDNGTASLKITIIDWEISGWYPEYWEFCNATICGRFKPEWLTIVPNVMSSYLHEYLMMQEIRKLLFY